MFSTAWNTQRERFTEFSREEKGEGGDRGDLVEKKGNQKGDREIKQVNSFRSKMSTEDWVLKGTKLITNTQKQRLKI